VPDDHVLSMRKAIGDKSNYDALNEGFKLTCDGYHFNREGGVKAAKYIFEQL
jgi:hypothetical protein